MFSMSIWPTVMFKKTRLVDSDNLTFDENQLTSQ